MDVDKAAAEVRALAETLKSAAAFLDERQHYEAEIKTLKEAAETAERREWLYRRVLRRYLDDVAALSVPSEETLQLMADLVREHP